MRACLQEAAKFYARNLETARPLLDARGIGPSTAERFLIGATQSKTFLRDALLDMGFSKDTIKLAGLLNRRGDDFFQDRIIVPIRVAGHVVSFYGRSLDEQAEVKHLRMTNDRLIIGVGPFNWDPRRSEIIITEGIMDALSLIEKGFTNAVAVLGTQGLLSEHNRELIKDSLVSRTYLCLDGDKAGRKAAIKSAYALEGLGLDVRVTDLDDKDPNEFMLAHSAEEFQERLARAVSPVQWEINEIDPESSPEDKIAALEGVFRRCKQMKRLVQVATIKRISALGFSEKDIRAHIESLDSESEGNVDFVDLDKCIHVHHALDMAGEVMLMTVPRAARNREYR